MAHGSSLDQACYLLGRRVDRHVIFNLEPNPTTVRIEDLFYGLNQIDVDVITNPLAISNKDELGHLAAPLWGRLPAMNAKFGFAFPHRNTSPQFNHCVKSKWSNNDRPVFPS
jgi:hypothetical protein